MALGLLHKADHTSLSELGSLSYSSFNILKALGFADNNFQFIL